MAERSAKARLDELVGAVRSQQFASQKELAAHFKVDPAQITRWKKEAIHTYNLITEKAWSEFLSTCLPEPDSPPFGGTEEF